VPGDVVLLEAGGVAADPRLLDTVGLRIEEAVLVGEAHPATKETKALLGRSLPLATGST
jgi:Ca2+-transporting ATPase